MQLNTDFNANDAALLEWYLDMGVDTFIDEESINRYESFEKEAAEAKIASTKKQRPSPRSATTFSLPKKTIAEMAPSFDTKSETFEKICKTKTLQELKNLLEEFDACQLKKTATNLVFADGKEDADVMVIGEAPEAEEDRQGLPFVGESGKLLDKMLGAIGLSREENVYISNVVPWRPPGNRQPSTTEIALCLPFIEQHIALKKPKLLMFLGGTATKALLSKEQEVIKSGITKLRGKWFTYKPTIIKGEEIPALIMYHPSYLLRSPQQKKWAWKDLLDFKDKL